MRVKRLVSAAATLKYILPHVLLLLHKPLNRSCNPEYAPQAAQRTQCLGEIRLNQHAHKDGDSPGYGHANHEAVVPAPALQRLPDKLAY